MVLLLSGVQNVLYIYPVFSVWYRYPGDNQIDESLPSLHKSATIKSAIFYPGELIRQMALSQKITPQP